MVTRFEGDVGRVSFIAAPSPGFERVLVGGLNGTVRVWKVPPRDARVVIQTTNTLYGAAFSPESDNIMIAGRDGVVRRASIIEGSAVAVTELKGHKALVNGVRFSPDGQSSLSFSIDGTVRIWKSTSEEPIRIFSEHKNAVGDVEYTDGGRRVLSVGDDGRLLRWSPHGNDAPAVLFEHRLPLNRLEVLSRNGHAVVHDSAGAAWDISATGLSKLIRRADGKVITVLRASADGRFLAIGTGTGAVTVYETDGYQIKYQPP